MTHEHAQFEDGSTSVEAGVLLMLDRMRGGRWKVFKGDNDAWLDEVRTYHRDAKTGLIVKEADDAIKRQPLRNDVVKACPHRCGEGGL